MKLGQGERKNKQQSQTINADAEPWSDVCQKHQETREFWMVSSALARNIRNVIRKGKKRLEKPSQTIVLIQEKCGSPIAGNVEC